MVVELGHMEILILIWGELPTVFHNGRSSFLGMIMVDDNIMSQLGHVCVISWGDLTIQESGHQVPCKATEIISEVRTTVCFLPETRH